MKRMILILTILTLTGCRHDSDCKFADQQTTIISNNQQNTILTPEPSTVYLMLIGIMSIVCIKLNERKKV